jgi:hypothetical protein
MPSSTNTAPWYRTALRWGQTNLTEIDPIRYDGAWWRAHWKETKVQGVIVNAGGIVAYYPSALKLHHRAQYLGDRDLFGEINADARADGLHVVARMDSNRADERFYIEHPDWFTVDQDGRPYRAGELFISCINGPYYDEFLPAVFEEIIDRYQPDGFADNSWSGLQRDRICYCPHCQRRFRERTGEALPRSHDWDNPVYREWIRWNYARRLEVWDRNNEIAQNRGGKHCLWIGMNAGDLTHQGRNFRDYRGIAERTELVFLDSQFRHHGAGFHRNGEMGTLIHGLLGWDKLIPESMAMYGAGQPSFRIASKSPQDARYWAIDGFAGGIQPWWHHIGAYHEDRRQYRTAAPLFSWHQDNESVLVDRLPVATVGVVWSQENIDFYGRDQADDRYRLPWTGITDALIRARIPYLPIHADHIARDVERFGLKTLVLPNLGIITPSQAEAITSFVRAGGGILATGETSLFNEDGIRQDDFALANVLGVHATGSHHGSDRDDRAAWDEWGQHSYLRLSPERRRWVNGPQTGTEPEEDLPRHEILAGFEDTDTIPFGGRLEVVQAAPGSQALITLVPPFPIYPPETSWMRHPSSDVPALVLNEDSGGRVAYLAADLDRCFGRSRLPDHARLLANLLRWTAGNAIPIDIDGPGFLHCQLYQQRDRLILHVVNLTGHEMGHAPADQAFPMGPLTVTIREPGWNASATTARLLVMGRPAETRRGDGGVEFTIDRIDDHEVIVLERK